MFGIRVELSRLGTLLPAPKKVISVSGMCTLPYYIVLLTRAVVQWRTHGKEEEKKYNI